jgi:hypothetical protein
MALAIRARVPVDLLCARAGDPLTMDTALYDSRHPPLCASRRAGQKARRRTVNSDPASARHHPKFKKGARRQSPIEGNPQPFGSELGRIRGICLSGGRAINVPETV